jgi:hypothetical protein
MVAPDAFAGDGVEMTGRWTKKLRTCLGLVAVVGFAAEPVAAQLYLNQPDFRRGPIEGSDPLVGVAIPGATPNEYRAHLLWNMRAGLNVAALQCQFSKYLRAVDNYNALLAHHSGELANAYTALNTYFRRVHGAQGSRRFDDYSTITYNNFSTLQAQMGFCQTAADIAKDALSRRKGELHLVATARMRELRNSLIPVVDRPPALSTAALRALPMPSLADPCAGLRGRNLRRCQNPRQG